MAVANLGYYCARLWNSRIDAKSNPSLFASISYRFTSVLPTKDPRCIERIIVWDETAQHEERHQPELKDWNEKGDDDENDDSR